MSLTLHFHPLSSYCMKALVGLYELGVPFTANLVDLGDPAQRAALAKLWPMAKFPVLRDEARGETVVESTIILDWLDHHHGGGLVPEAADAARECRLRDRFFDLYVNDPMGRIVMDKLRPVEKRDPLAVEQAKAQLSTAYGIAEEWLQRGPWALGDAFSMADCAAAPALFYADKVLPLGHHRNVSAYLARLRERPSFARVLREAEPYFSMFPG